MAIPNPNIYNQNEAAIASDLQPPHKRLTGWLEWYTSLLSPNQRDRDLLFDSYANGSAAPNWVASTPYPYLQQVIYVDGSVYELQNVAGLTSATPPNEDTDNWLKIQDTWIGSRERAKYNGQLIMVEYILNKYFKVPPTTLPFTGASHSTQMWILNTANSNGNFWLSNGGVGALTGYMSNTSKFQRNFMGNSYTYNPNAFTIKVPVAVYNAIAAIQPSGVSSPGDPAPDAAGAAIRAVADKYVQAGKIYLIETY